MSDIARLNLALSVTVFAFAVIVYAAWPTTHTEPPQALASPYCANISIEVPSNARALYAKDIVSGKTIYAFDASTQLPLASITKLMTVYTAMQILSDDDQITISNDAQTPEGAGLGLGEVWRAKDLADYTLIASVNDGARALALAAANKNNETYDAFIDRMNANAREIGLVQTFFANETGLDLSTTVGASYGSAEDIALFLEHIHTTDPSLLEPTTHETIVFTAQSGETHKAHNTSELTPTLVGAIGSKTGFTDLAGGNLALIFEPMPGRPVAAVVLGSTREGRDTDMATLTQEVRKWLTHSIVCQG